MRTGKGARGIKGLRMNMVLRPKLRFSYTSAQQHIKDNTGKSAHGFRRGALSDLKHDRQASGKGDGVRLAKTLADHADETTTEEYMDEYEDRDALARAFDEMDPATPASPAAVPKGADNKVVDLTARRRAKRAG
jgi:integrase